VVVIPPGSTTPPTNVDITQGGGHMAKKGGKKAFGGYSLSFKGCHDTLESLFGSSPIGPSEMTKRLWAYVKRKKLGGKR
jgi:hypothetical protein